MEDTDLIDSILDGNIDSFNILMNKYEKMVLRFIYNLIKDKEAAEDITQETFITVYNKLYMFDNKYKFSNWILQVAKNKSIDYVRKYRRVYEANIEELHDIKSMNISPEQSAEYKETKEQIESFIKELEPIDREILILKYSSQMTFKDIAEVVDLNISVIKRRYYNMREEFKVYTKVTKRGVTSGM